MRLTRKYRKSRRGAIVVEMALTVPLLLFIVFASYEFSRANMLRHTADSAAYEGARQGILPGASQKSVEDSTNFVLSSIGTRDAQIEIEPLPITPQNETIQVTVIVPLNSNMFFAPFFFKNGEVRGNCELAREKAF